MDRDGVINEPVVVNGRPHPPASLAELVLSPGVAAALNSLKALGFALVVVTNQPDVPRGKTKLETVAEIHDFLAARLPLDSIRACFHDTPDNCACRKPKPGLLLGAASELNLSMRGCYMIGDRWVDVEAGRAAGCVTIFIDRGYDERRPDNPDFTCPSLTEAAEWIARREGRS